ncbi:MAG: hypothetical protein ACLRTG_10610 [Enterocloster aldenensis]
MDKVERVLMLFWQLYSGMRVSKATFCFEMDITPRTFDRDIEAIRNFLSDGYLGQEVVFDRMSNTYRMTGSIKKTLTEVEYTAITVILLGSKALRADEMNGLVKSLGKLTERRAEGVKTEISRMLCEYVETVHYNAILKMQWDLFQCIKRKVIIRMQYLNEQGEGEETLVIPCVLFFDSYHYRLRAVELNEGGMEEYYVDRIEAFEIVRNLNLTERRLYFTEKENEGDTEYGKEN